jgi:lysophospholipase L1-like esterase
VATDNLNVLDANANARVLKAVNRGGVFYPVTAVTPGPALAARGRQGQARVAGGSDAGVGQNDFGVSGAGTESWFSSGNRGRVWCDGAVRRVKIYLKHTDGISSLKVWLWRRTGSLQYPAAVSEELVGQLISDQVNDLFLQRPLQAKCGDWIGGVIVTTVGAYQLRDLNANHCTLYRRTSVPPTTEGDNLSTWTATAGYYLPIELYGDPVDHLWLGHSHASGYPLQYGPLQDSVVWDVTSDPGALMAALMPGSRSVNAGIGSELAADCATRAPSAIGRSLPAFTIVITGIVDIIGGASDPAPYAAAAAAIARAAELAGSVTVWVDMLPCTQATNLQMARRDVFTAAAIAALEPYPAIIVDADTALGQERVGGNPGNLWDLQAAYDTGDGLHLNAAGYGVLAATVAACMPIV